MKENIPDKKKKRPIAGIIAVAACAVVLFLCIFSLYHLPERDPVETPDIAVNPNYVESPAGDFEETDDILSSSQEEVSGMLGELEMQYQNAQLNDEPYAAQQAGMRLALAYYKTGDTQQAETLLNNLISTYEYDDAFVAKCRELLKTINP